MACCLQSANHLEILNERTNDSHRAHLPSTASTLLIFLLKSCEALHQKYINLDFNNKVSRSRIGTFIVLEKMSVRSIIRLRRFSLRWYHSSLFAWR